MIDVHKIVEEKNIKFSNQVSFKHWNKSGYIKKGMMWVNQPNYISERYMIAHLLGHYEHIQDDTIYEPHENGLKETQAHLYALRLLMPSQLVCKEIRRLVNALKKHNEVMTIHQAVKVLAGLFSVSPEHMSERLIQLSFIKEVPCTDISTTVV